MAQVKVTVLASEIGVLILRRLARPNADKSGELRRLAELGYACERAGFILDGTVLRNGGRAWDVQPDLHPETQDTPPTPGIIGSDNAAVSVALDGPSTTLPRERMAAQRADHSDPAQVGDVKGPSAGLRARLGKLSGT